MLLGIGPVERSLALQSNHVSLCQEPLVGGRPLRSLSSPPGRSTRRFRHFKQFVPLSPLPPRIPTSVGPQPDGRITRALRHKRHCVQCPPTRILGVDSSWEPSSSVTDFPAMAYSITTTSTAPISGAHHSLLPLVSAFSKPMELPNTLLYVFPFSSPLLFNSLYFSISEGTTLR